MAWLINSCGVLGVLVGVAIALGAGSEPNLVEIGAGIIVAQAGVANLALGAILLTLQQSRHQYPKAS